jgi:D-amino peptidase
MRIYLMTDMEGVCGIVNFEDWCVPASRYYEKGKALLTQEVNAAIDGFLAAGATAVTVADGHGCGAVDSTLLHPRAELMRGWPESWPFFLDAAQYDAVAWVGQHAKAGTCLAHLAHTQSFGYRDESVNGVSIGEFGQFALCAGELGVRAIFGSGDQAFADEAQALIPGIGTVAVKRGTQSDPGHCLPEAAYSRHNVHAVHLSPEEARKRIRAGAEAALRRAAQESFGLLKLPAPYSRVTVLRGTEAQPPRVARNTHPTSIIQLFRQPFSFQPIQRCDPLALA